METLFFCAALTVRRGTQLIEERRALRAGTVVVKDLYRAGGSYPFGFVDVNGTLFFCPRTTSSTENEIVEDRWDSRRPLFWSRDPQSGDR